MVIIEKLNDCSEVPWVVVGDFNEILFSFEKQGGFSDIGALTSEAKELAKAFRVCLFHWVDRTGNRVAHTLAREGFQRQVDTFWVVEVSDSVVAMVEKDRCCLDPP